MTYLPQLFAIASIILLACISPGPDFVAITSNALTSRRNGMMVALGVALGCVVWAALAVFGLGVLLTRIGWLYSVVRYLGAAYLIYLGVRMLLSARHAPAKLEETQAAAPEPALLAFRRGLLVNLANPKAAAFFGSLFVSVLPQDAPVWVHAATIGTVGLVSTIWFLCLALMFSARRVRSVYERLRRPADALMGVALVGLGGKLAMSR